MAPRILLAICLLLVFGCERKDETPSAPPIEVLISHGPELRELINSARETFLAQNPKLTTGSEIKPKLIEENVAAASKRSPETNSKLTGWLAPSTALVEVISRSIEGTGANSFECQPLFSSPIVIAAQRGTFETPEFPQEVSLATVLKSASLAAAKRVILSLPDPGNSVSGFMAALAWAQLFRQADMTLADPILASNELIQLCGNNDRSLLKWASHPTQIAQHATLTTEQQLISYNQNPEPGSLPLVAFYPAEGTLWQDYSACKVLSEWVSAAQHAAFKRFADFLASEEIQNLAGQKGFRPATVNKVSPEVFGPSLGVHVKLPRRNLEKVSVSHTKRALYDWSDLLRPLDTIIAIDTSASMAGEPIRAAKEAARNLILKGSKADRFALIRFSSTVETAAPLESDSAAFQAALEKIKTFGGSGTFDGLAASLSLLMDNPEPLRRKKIYLITDGEGGGSIVAASEIITTSSKALNEQFIEIDIACIKTPDAKCASLKEIASNIDANFKEVSVPELFGE